LVNTSSATRHVARNCIRAGESSNRVSTFKYFYFFGVWLLSGICRKKRPKCMWLCAGISPLLFRLQTWSKRQKTRQVFF